MNVKKGTQKVRNKNQLSIVKLNEIVGSLCLEDQNGCDYNVARYKFYNYIVFIKAIRSIPNRLKFYVGHPTKLLNVCFEKSYHVDWC